MRILIVCERLSGPDDEGIKNLASGLWRSLASRHEVLALTRAPSDRVGAGLEAVRMNRFFLNPALLGRARRFRPAAVLYVPWTSGTARTFFRARLLRLASGAPAAVLLTQPYDAPAWERALIRALRPDLVFAQSDSVLDEARGLGSPAEFFPGGIDLVRFRPPGPGEREAARRRLGLGAAERLVLHVGHLNRERLDAAELSLLARAPGRRLLVVGSTDTPRDPGLVRDLRDNGITVVDDFVPRIETLYWAADVYLFPTRARRSSIGVPLSVLEALACGLPVVTTRFEGLPRLFPDSRFVRFADDPRDLDAAIGAAAPAPDTGARSLVEPLSWDRMANLVGDRLGRLAGSVPAEGSS